MKQIQALILLLFIAISCSGQTTREAFHNSNNVGFLGLSYDADAQAYFTAAGGLSTLEKDTWNTFVIAAKANGYWSKIYVINPVLGSSAAQHAVNAKTPGTYDATYVGTVTHTSAHMVGDGSTGYVNTGFNMNGGDADGFATIAVWVRNSIQGAFPVIGAISATNRYTQIYPWFGNTLYGQVNTNNSIAEGATYTNSIGLSLATRTGATAAYIQRGATQTTGFTTASLITNNNLYVLAQNNNGSAAFFTTYQVSMYMIANAFTTTEASSFYTDFSAVITALSR